MGAPWEFMQTVFFHFPSFSPVLFSPLPWLYPGHSVGNQWPIQVSKTPPLTGSALRQPARSRLTFALAADLESIRSLAAAVKKFEGAVVIVSHDEQLLSLACSQLWSVLLTRTRIPSAGGG